ncbi:hypothetical protein E3Q18_01550 [Wallemia mellicola]|nr:hypothetical protein E3Q18_01550 [Wallemia mellicola]
MNDWSADAVIDQLLSTNNLPSRTALIAAIIAILLYLQWQAIIVVVLAGYLATSQHFSILVKTLLHDDNSIELIRSQSDEGVVESREAALKSLPGLLTRQKSSSGDKLNVLPELSEPLDSTLNLVIRDFVEWWYIPLALDPPDMAFPRECRRSLNHITSSICQRVVDGRSGTDIAIFLFCSTAQTLLRGLRTRRMPNGKLTDKIEPKESQDYHPLLRNTAAQILSLSSSHRDAENPALQSLLTEIVAGQIEAVVQILTPDWVNLTVIAFFEDEKKEQRVREEAERMRQKVEQVVNADTIPGEFKDDIETSDETKQNEINESNVKNEKNDSDIPQNDDNADEKPAVSDTTMMEKRPPHKETHHGQKPSIYIPPKKEPVPLEEGDLGETPSDKKPSVISPFNKQLHDSFGDIGVKDKSEEDTGDTPSLRDVLSHRNDSDVYDDFERFLEMRRREGLLRLLTQVTTFKEIVSITSPSEPIFRQDAIALLARAEEAVLPGDTLLLDSINATRMKIEVDASLNAFLPIEVEIYTNLESEYATFVNIKRDSVSNSSNTHSFDYSQSQSTARTSIEPRISKEYEASYYQRQTKVDVTDLSANAQTGDFVNGKTLELMIAIEEEGLPGWMLFRRWNEFEKLDNALQKAFPMAGTASFPKAYLPTLKFKKSEDICALLGAYIKTLLIDPRYSESAIVTNFLKKEQTETTAKSSKLFNLTQPGKTFTEFAQAVSDIGVNKKRLSFPGPMKLGENRTTVAPSTQSKEQLGTISSEAINEVDKTPSEEVDYKNYTNLGQDEKEEEEKSSSYSENDAEEENEVPSIAVAETQEPIVESPSSEGATNEAATPNGAATPVTPTSPSKSSRIVSNINDEDLNLVLNSIFSILEEAYQLSGQQWSLRRGFFRVLERVIRTSYSSTVRLALQSIVEGVTEVKNVSQLLNSLRDALWPPPQREWVTAEQNTRTEEEKAETRELAKKLLVNNKPRALSGAMGDSATREAVILLHELFQDEEFCKEIATLLALDLLRGTMMFARQISQTSKRTLRCGYSTSVVPPRSAVNTSQERGNPVAELPGQAEDRATKWSPRQRSKEDAYVGARFEQTHLGLQPNPKAAIELIAQEPVRLVEGRVASCDGGGGPLGHPKIYIKLDKPGAHACGYW